LINIARENDIPVISIPGASALMASISISGKPLNEFVFDGFFPRTNKDQLILLSKLNLRKEDTFVFESPKRISKTINLLKEKLKDRNIILFHELTKFHEKVISFNLNEIDTATIPNIGEFVILISGENSKNELFDEDFDKYVKVELEYMIQNGVSLKNATKIISEIFDLPRKDIYNIWIEK
jgi:16S rRNA (cytidine1402-2'-O)-methyltransferase